MISDHAMIHAIKLSILENKSILLKHVNHSKSYIEVNEDGEERFFIDDYDTIILSIFKTNKEFILVTEDNIYIVSSHIPFYYLIK